MIYTCKTTDSLTYINDLYLNYRIFLDKIVATGNTISDCIMLLPSLQYIPTAFAVNLSNYQCLRWDFWTTLIVHHYYLMANTVLVGLTPINHFPIF